MQTEPEDLTHCDDGAGALPNGTMLRQDQYTIEHFHVRGGFGLTYIARDTLKRRVLIKECFTDSICTRHDAAVTPIEHEKAPQFRKIKARFAIEAELMARIKHPSVPTVHQMFVQNNTHYLVTDLIEGTDLLNVALWDPQHLTPMLVRTLLNQALSTLSALHDTGVVHRDVSPDNFILDHNNALHLIDFGNATDRTAQDNPVVSTKAGYAPPEHYEPGSHTAITSDIYALAATFHLLITGHAPVAAPTRQAAHVDPYRPLAQSRRDFDPVFLGLMDDALALDPANRPQTAEAWSDALRSSGQRVKIDNKQPDPKVTRVISTMVAETNAQVLSPAPPPPQQPPTTRPLLSANVFDDPMEDYDLWLAKQKELAAQNRCAVGNSSILKSVASRLHTWLPRPAVAPQPQFVERKPR